MPTHYGLRTPLTPRWIACSNCREPRSRDRDRVCAACILAVVNAVEQALARRRAWVEMRREVEKGEARMLVDKWGSEERAAAIEAASYIMGVTR